MKSIICSMILVGMLVFCVAGCNKAPKGVPKLYHSTVKVVNSEGPISDVNVLFYSEDEMKELTVTGTTDSSGVAVMKTLRASWVGGGAPLGHFKVTLNKETAGADDMTAGKYHAMSEKEKNEYKRELQQKLDDLAKVIPTKLKNPGTTPLSVEVTKKGGELLSIDVSDYK
ncbi:MAG: hypothetical protein Q4G68_05450 [Planctomycetia bacterium]|nr:hypothetical protein [Planctomycetia bacterium]